jgi:hypothetical protein
MNNRQKLAVSGLVSSDNQVKEKDTGKLFKIFIGFKVQQKIDVKFDLLINNQKYQ